VDDRRFGQLVRALRRRLGWRQVDLAERAGVSQQTVSEIERGHLRDKAVGTVRATVGALDARAEFQLLWRGGAADRLLDRIHAALVERVVAVMRELGWEVLAEVSFSHYGERGSIDVLAWKAALRAVVIGEIKSDITSVEETNRRLDVKERVVPIVVRERLGWTPLVVGTLLVLPDERHLGGESPGTV
jgi:transcriptional regulator with XRE-family HTH domain